MFQLIRHWDNATNAAAMTIYGSRAEFALSDQRRVRIEFTRVHNAKFRDPTFY